MTLYFFSQFLQYFIISSCSLVTIFTMSNVFIRLPFLISPYAVKIVATTMLPIVALFAIPISSCISIHLVLTKSKQNNELLYLQYISNARKSLELSVIFFSLITTLVYMPIIFHWGPNGYLNGKKAIVEIAKTDLVSLSPKELHKPTPEICFYFKTKDRKNAKQPILKDIFFSIKNKKGNYSFTSKYGTFENDHLILKHGAMNVLHNKKLGVINFDIIDTNTSLIKKNEDISINKQPKFCTANKLFKNINKPFAMQELFKRCAQILWIFLIPIFSLFIAFSFNVICGSALLSSIIISCILYSLMHISFAIFSFTEKMLLLNIFSVFIFILLLFVFLFISYKKSL